MGVVTVKSASITNRDASPAVLNNAPITKGAMQKAMGVVTLANGDSIASKYIACSIPSNAIPYSCLYSAPDIGTTTAGDIGLYDTTANGSAVVDADFFKAANVLNAGPYQKVEIINGNVVTVAKMEQRVWELLGLTSDPGKMYDVCLTLTAAADAAGAVAVEVVYAI